MWVFGYGSLIWKVDFPYEERLVGCVKGYTRRFYQLSTDHRGTPQNPGRVVTLIPAELEDEVWGVAYRISEEEAEKVMSQLDYREKGGYERHVVTFYPQSFNSQPFNITIYLATTDNFQYGGEADLDDIAEQIFASEGPSGSNTEYLFNLASAMRQIAPEVVDEHLIALEIKVLDLIAESERNVVDDNIDNNNSGSEI